MASANKHEVFISYSHRDADWRRKLDSFLQILRFRFGEDEVGIRYWSDEDIATGADWESEIKTAIDRASAAVLLVSADFLSSQFIMRKEVPLILARKEEHAMPIMPFVIRPCPWDRFDWIRELNIFRQGEALSSLSPSDQDARLTECSTRLKPTSVHQMRNWRNLSRLQRPWKTPVQAQIESRLIGS